MLLWTGLLHQLVGVLLGAGVVMAILQDGYVGAIELDWQRSALFWYLVTGFMIIFAARALAWIERERPLPVGLGWGLLAIGVLGGLAIPVSGFWLVVPQGLLVLRRARSPALPWMLISLRSASIPRSLPEIRRCSDGERGNEEDAMGGPASESWTQAASATSRSRSSSTARTCGLGADGGQARAPAPVPS